ncbi:uncharacterized protein STEHIDRAFT_144850 [Stereum hirsutum FP-91666 SS1]|uniref:uncharacterized protein n=1 Tax=Stereum hirsutum (strain FP-91666) TaxID=721885 RepID=UPI000440CDE8|nr:uncharacterized protein STEHIDRAFT_144850 [Stereum hirsutum FP-91666 SS1]EIM89454.1 hypothetical protein STEHIDRAFT_144850 [Stereum hirsutum FP-91666 SS1]
MYAAKVFRVNYTTYDLRRAYDSVNPRTQANVMVYSPETGPNTPPYWYARVLGVFHANIRHVGSNSRNREVQRIEFLWVRWYGAEHGYRYGSKLARLPKIGFVEDTDDYAFGFLDPALVIRGCHLIPAFAGGRTSNLLHTIEPTAARPLGDVDDWVNFYVNIWVDRDMFMRYLGGGVGHSTNATRNTSAGDAEDTAEDEIAGDTQSDEASDIEEHDGGGGVDDIEGRADDDENEDEDDEQDEEDDMEDDEQAEEEDEGDEEVLSASDDDDLGGSDASEEDNDGYASLS